MAFGDIIQKVEANNSGTSLAASFPLTPVSGNLLVAGHMTGAASSTGCSSTSGTYTSALQITNATESDESEIYFRIAGASEATSVTATASASDENVLLLLEIEGPWEASPLDLAEASARDPSGTSLALSTTGATSQADEVAIAFAYTRFAGNNDGTDTWSNSFVRDGGLADNSSFKSFAAATKLLTATGTQSTTYAFTTDTVSQGGIVTFKKQVVAGGVTIAGTLGLLGVGI